MPAAPCNMICEGKCGDGCGFNILDPCGDCVEENEEAMAALKGDPELSAKYETAVAERKAKEAE